MLPIYTIKPTLTPPASIASLKKFSQFEEWLESSTNDADRKKHFWLVGKLTRLLIAGDLAYAGVIDKPTVEEMGALIAKVSKGAIAGMVYLNLLPGRAKNYHYPARQTALAFKELYDRLKEELSDDERDRMGMDAIVLEHSLCKLKRMHKLKLL